MAALDRLERDGGGVVGPGGDEPGLPAESPAEVPAEGRDTGPAGGQAADRRVVRAHGCRAGQPREGRRVQAVRAQEAGLHALLARPPPERPHLLGATREEDEIRALGLERGDDGVELGPLVRSLESEDADASPRGLGAEELRDVLARRGRVVEDVRALGRERGGREDRRGRPLDVVPASRRG